MKYPIVRLNRPIRPVESLPCSSYGDRPIGWAVVFHYLSNVDYPASDEH